MLIQFRNTIPVALAVCFLATSNANAQVNSTATTNLNSPRSEGLTLNVIRPISVKPKSLRVVFQFKAEDATHDKAIEKISLHMKSIQASLTELGAVASSIEYAEIETNPSSANPYSVAQAQMGVQVNALPAFQAVQIAPAMPINAVQGMPAMRLTPAQRTEPAKSLPTFVIATSAVSADWNIEGKSPVEIAAMKPRLLAAIAKENLDGKNLAHKFTPEQEDEIFEITKIDIRNGDTRSMFSIPVAAPRSFFVGYVAESDNAEAMKTAFQSAEKMATQMARAGNLKLGKIESVNVAVGPRLAASGTSLPSPTYYSYPSYPVASSSTFNDWEPLIPTGEIRMDSLNQLKQNLSLTVRYRIE
jgi:Protein of unknown function (DUF541)